MEVFIKNAKLTHEVTIDQCVAQNITFSRELTAVCSSFAWYTFGGSDPAAPD